MSDEANEAASQDGRNQYAVWRIDDNGNTFMVREHVSREDAERLVAEFTARGHKQMYWAEVEGV
jgi:UDP-N-acetyl-2-amino-2-deoxyglucuronate dehydrogenase